MTAFAVCLVSTFAAPSDSVDAIVQRWMTDRNIQGAAVAIVRADTEPDLRTYGIANVELQVPVSIDTVFEVGSITKQFTAVGILRLVERGQVRLDASIRDYVPNAPQAWQPVTIAHLLTHTSGVKTYTGLTGFEATRKLTQAQFVREIGRHPLDFRPGTRYNYSNTGYNLLGYVIENVTKKPYWDFLRDEIWQPAGMTTAGNRDLFTVIPHRADGYEFRNGRLFNRDSDLTDVFAAGAMTANIRDMAAWVRQLGSEALLKPDTWRQMWTRYRLSNGQEANYGFGFRFEDVQGSRAIGHGGSTAGFSSALYYIPDRRLGVVVLTNAGEVGVASRLLLEILREVAK